MRSCFPSSSSFLSCGQQAEVYEEEDDVDDDDGTSVVQCSVVL